MLTCLGRCKKTTALLCKECSPLVPREIQRELKLAQSRWVWYHDRNIINGEATRKFRIAMDHALKAISTNRWLFRRR